jgi:hypothetical protein
VVSTVANEMINKITLDTCAKFCTRSSKQLALNCAPDPCIHRHSFIKCRENNQQLLTICNELNEASYQQQLEEDRQKKIKRNKEWKEINVQLFTKIHDDVYDELYNEV